LLAAAIAFIVPTAAPAPVLAAGPACATPGRDGTATLSGIVNTYYPGTATVAAGTSAITLGPATGAATPIAVGDLLLVIQMQDAAIDSSNTGAYGDGAAGDPATGWTGLNSSGLYEYTVATSAVPLAGGALTVGGSGLINTYTSAAPTPTQGQRGFQVIRVPQYVAATLTGALTAAPFNGSTGGVLALDVDGALNLNAATVSVAQEGFRAGFGRQLTGGPGGTGTDYRNLSANNFHGQKGEGIAGTPQYVYDSRAGSSVNNAVDGYPNGSTARGAPGTAGGGGTDPDPGTPPPNGNDQNTGGGGGANGGAGGMGGNSWNTNLAMGGFGGTAFPATAARVTAGAGGGAGTRNNSGAIANESSGGNGGGIVMIRTGSVAGTGTIMADGGTGVTPANDGGGGGGAGGSIAVVTQTGALGGLTTSAQGGVGTDAWPTDAGGTGDYHGPGGGGGGGVVLTTSAPGTFNVNGGANGTTTTDRAAYGATPGAAGTHSIITANQIPGTGSGAQCTSDLTIAKSHTDPFVRGSTGTYTVTVSNVGGTATSGTSTVTDTLPAGLTPTAAAGTGWTCSIVAQTVTCTSTAVVASNGSFPPISITVSVTQSAASSVTNTATVSGGGEVNTANDTANDLTNIVSRADIAVAKIASSGTVTIGSNVTFTVTVTNNGPSDATGVQITDPLPAGLTYVSSTPSQGTYTSGTGLWDIGAMASGASVTLALTATVTTTGALTNTATKTHENETDPNLSNDSASVTITGQAPDLTIAKSHAGSFVRGSTGSYSVTVSNIGPVASSGLVTVSDTLPAGLAPSTAAGTGWTCGIAGQTVTCTRSDALGASASYPVITITVAVSQTATSPLINTATVAGGNEVNTANDSAADSTTITSQADIGVAKIASSGTVTVGSNVTFTITVSNLGPSNATGVHVSDPLPAGLTYVTSTPSQGSYTSGTGDWNIGAIANGNSATLSLTATVTSTGALINTATKSAEIETDPNAGNDSASATVNGQAPDLTIAKSHVGSFVRGSSGSYTVTVSNIGPVATSGLVTVSDTLPAGFTPSTASGTGWTCGIAAQAVTCTRADALASGASYPVITITVAVSQTATSPLTNTATVAGGNEINTANDSASDLTTITSVADIGVAKIASSGSVTVGSNVTFTITVSNLGPSNATGVHVSDPLPAGLTYVSSAPSQGSYASGSGDWNIGAIANGASVALSLTATVTTTGPHTNTATKSAEIETDPNGANDSASANVTGVVWPDMTIAKSHVDPFTRGTAGSYSVTVSNVGPVASSGLVTGSDTLPAGLTPSTASGTGWSCGIAAQTVTCTRSDALGAGASYPVITIVVAVSQTATSPLTNTATVAGGNEVNTANDTATDPTTITSAADIGITKIASSGSVTIGSNVTFTITAHNFGPSNATGVHVSDPLPGGLTYVSSAPSQGSYTSGTGDWNIGAIANGNSATLSLTATVTSTGALINTATKSAEIETDPNTGNDSASATVNGQAPDLTIAKSHTDPFVRGTTNTYQLIVSNIGPVPTSGTVTVVDTLPAGLTPSGPSGIGWACGTAAQTVTCTRGDALASAASYPPITITVTVLQTAPATVTNTATVSGGNEVNTANDSATDPTNITSVADIGLSKAANGATFVVGTNVTFTITANNLGPSNATGVHVTDVLPAGLTYVSSTPSQGTYTSLTGDWNVGSIASGTLATLTLTARVTQTGTLANTALKTAANETDPNAVNDSASAAITGQAPDLTIAKSHVDPFVRGSSQTYSLVVSNIGTAATSGVVTVTDTLPAGLTPIQAVGTGWTCGVVAQTVTCNRSDLLATAAAYPTITITVTVAQSAPASITNTAVVAGGNELNTANDTASDPTNTVSLADVSVTKIASSGTVTVGSNVTYTITAHNAGPSDATGVQVTDLLPAGLTLVSATPATGSYVAGTGVWTIGSLASGTSTTLSVVATVTTTGAVINTASKTAENEPDPNPGNDVSSATITGTGLPGPPNGGMAPTPNAPDPLRGSLLLQGALAGFFGLLFLRRRSHRVGVAAGLMALATLTAVLAPAGSPLSAAPVASHLAVRPPDRELFGKPISTVKPELGALATTFHPASGPITPYRIRIPALGIDTVVESVGLTARGLMDVPGNLWDTAWLQTGVKPGASGQAIIDGHLDSVSGSAVFSALHRLQPGDQIYVSDASGAELAFRVRALAVEPLDGFPSLQVFGPAHGRFLNLITCAGQYDRVRRTYDHRLVVFAEL
jgi:uncharacterized repeat protein (TIGR01451 family)